MQSLQLAAFSSSMEPPPHMLHPLMSLIIIIITTSLGPSSSGVDIPLGSCLKASEPGRSWSSSTSAFSFGFVPTEEPATRPSSFTASITFYGGVPVWSAGNGASVDAGGSLQLLPSGNLRLLTGSGSVVWESGTAGRGVNSAAVDDLGNFSLRNGSFTVWSSFENPTDTVLPGQNFSAGALLRNGLYSFSFLRAGDLTLRWNNSAVYWNRGLNSSVDSNPWNNVVNGTPSLNFSVDLVSPVLRLQPIGILSISDPALPSGAIMAYSSDYVESNDTLRFLKLDRDGNLRIYSSVRGSGTASLRWAAIQDQCLVWGYCGNMGICYYDSRSRPSCGCPSGNFEPVDPKDGRKGCRRKVGIEACHGNSTLVELKHTQFLDLSGAFKSNISACRSKCEETGSCVLSTFMYDGTAACFLTKSTDQFVGGYHAPALPSTSFVKVCKPALQLSLTHAVNDGKARDAGSNIWMLSGIILVTTLVGLVACQAGLWWCFMNDHRVRGLSGPPNYALLEYGSGIPLQFSYKELLRVTRDFKDVLGVGRHGSVYRGTLASGTIVAVKLLRGIETTCERDLRVELAIICSTHHLNLVRVIGYCSERSNRILVYEFMARGSLDRFLFGSEEEEPIRSLDWARRFKIALGTAKGMSYLHEECHRSIIHYNLRPENILLDEDFNAKVSDFGLVKLTCGSPDGDRFRSAFPSIRGPEGYLAPERLLNLPITSKSDVYSFGVVLLEIVSGRRNSDASAETGGRKFSAWARDELEKGNLWGILDKRIRGRDADLVEVKRVLEVSSWCTQDRPSQRPRMGEVVQMLEGVVSVQKAPALLPCIPISFSSAASLSKHDSRNPSASAFFSR